jgi:hypothetical protein
MTRFSTCENSNPKSPGGSCPQRADHGLRLFFGSAMLLSIFLGVAAIWQRDFAAHGNWMLRGYTIGMGAGTQALTLMAGELSVGPPRKLSRALLMGAGNLAVAGALYEAFLIE